MIIKNIEYLDDLFIAEELFSLYNAQLVDDVFSELERISPARLEMVAYYAEKFAEDYLTRRVLTLGIEQARYDLEENVQTWGDLIELRKMAEICLRAYQIRRDSVNDTIRSFAEAVDQLSDMDLGGPGIKKAYHALISKIEEDHFPPPPLKPKRKWGGFGSRNPGF